MSRSKVHATFHPGDREELARLIAECLNPNGTGWFSMDHRVVWPGGETRWLRVRKQVYFDGEGSNRKPHRAMLAAFDITAEKQTTERLRESEERFRNLAENIPQLVWVTNPHGDKMFCNQRYLDYVGATSKEFIGKQWIECIHPDDREATGAKWKHALATGEAYRAEYRLRRHDGFYRYFLAQAIAVRNQNGEIEGWQGTSTDIHEQKLGQDALRRTEKLAVAGQLAASVAHEINNPLESITNLLYLLSTDSSLGSDAYKYVRTAQGELSRVSEITTQALRFHQQSVSASPVHVQSVLGAVLSLYQTRIQAADLKVICEY